MIRLHHLNQSRSLRILWLLEELGEEYEVIPYQRDGETHLAPDSLKEVHPLGKSPVIEIDGHVVAESGAIVELLIQRFAKDRLRPSVDSPAYGEYLQWIEFAESSLMLPLLLEIFINAAALNDNEFLTAYSAHEKRKLLSYLDDSLQDKTFIVDDKLSGADFMLSFNLIMLEQKGQLEDYPHIKQYIANLSQLASFQRAIHLEEQYDQAR